MTRAALTGQGASPQRLPSAHLTTLSFAISFGLYTAPESARHTLTSLSVIPHEELTLALILLLLRRLSPTVLYFYLKACRLQYWRDRVRFQHWTERVGYQVKIFYYI